MGPYISIIFDRLLEVFFEWLDDCSAEDDQQNAQAHTDPNKVVRMRERIRNPGIRHLIRMGREYRLEQGWDRRTWRQNRRSVIANLRADCAALSNEDCDELLAEHAEDKATTAERAKLYG